MFGRQSLVHLLFGCVQNRGWSLKTSPQRVLMMYSLKKKVFSTSELVDSGVESRDLSVNFLRGARSVGALDAVTKARRLCQEGHLDEAFQGVELMEREGIFPSLHSLHYLLQGCLAKKDIALGRQVHRLIIGNGLESNVFFGNHLIRMYSACGSLREANHVFSKLSAPDKHAWAAVISANGKHGEAELALKLYEEMRCSSVDPNEHIFVSVLNACATAKKLAEGKLVHTQIVESGCLSNVFVGNALIDMYAKCGSLEDAYRVFCRWPIRDLVTWNTMIAGYVMHKRDLDAVQLFEQMQQEGMWPDRFTLFSVLKGCSSLGALEMGKLIHFLGVKNGGKLDGFVVSALICMYAKCGSVDDARLLFDRTTQKDLVIWSSMIAAYSRGEHGYEAVKLFQQMQVEGLKPDEVVLSSILNACSSLAALELGKLVHHAHVMKSECQSSVFIGNTLIDLYVKCGSMFEARKVFHSLPTTDLVTWTTLIAGYAQHGDGQEALQLFQEMLQEGVQPNNVTHVSILRACSSIGALEQGRLLHTYIMEIGLELELQIGNILIDMYAKCGSLEDARMVFDKLPVKGLVIWNSMIAMYAQLGDGQEALKLFHQMRIEGFQPDKILLTSILKACSSIGALEEGMLLHAHVLENCYLSDAFLGSSLLDMYVKCGSMVEARRVFDRSPIRDAVSWSAMISGYVQQKAGQEVLRLFQQMQEEGVWPDKITLASILKACSSAASLEQGKRLHASIVESGLECDLFVGCSLIDMYARCGSLDGARRVFEKSPSRSLALWNALIAGYAQHGESEVALRLFQQMLKEGFQPDKVTFVCLLSACSRSCLLAEGSFLFHAMSERFGITREMEHFGCMVDLFGRSGHLQEADDLISQMPVHADTVVWMTLLGACRIHGNVELGRRCFEAILKLDATTAAAYVLMADIYSQAGKLEEKAEIRKKMHHAGVKKEPGLTWMEFKDGVHTFVVEDREHPERRQIYEKLRTLADTIEKDPGTTTQLNSRHAGLEGTARCS